jgi:glycosyltransferase involved in cell wall biosynthesis
LLQDKDLSANIAAEGKKMVEGRFFWDGISSSYEQIFLGQHSVSATYGQHRVLTILIATPLLPPQLGGPAQYAQNLAKEFSSLGNEIKVVSFGKYLRFPTGIRHFFYLADLIRYATKSQVIFALDYTSVGLPAAFVSLIFRKPLVIRVEGNFLWESFVERRRLDVTLKEFYKNPPPLALKEGLIKWLSGWVMRHASKLVFSSEWRRSMIVDAYKIPLEKTEIIRNAFPPVNLQSTSYSPRSGYGGAGKLQAKVILWAGRILYLKNLHRLIRAFAGIGVSSYELHLVGEGPERGNLERLIKEHCAENRIKFFPAMGHQELMEKLALSTAVVLPSLSDVGPNIVAEAIANVVPVIMTKESGYAEIFRDTVILIDPLSETDLYEKLEKFIKEPRERTIPRMGFSRSWTAAAKDWLKLFQEIA